MKKVAIVTRKMIIGGIEKALIEMIKAMPEDEYEIDLYVMARGGEFEKYIPKRVNIINIYGDEKTLFEKLKKKIIKFKLIEAIKILFYNVIAIKFCKFGYEQEKWLAKQLKKIDKQYDIAISYHVPTSFPVIYTIDHLKAHKKLAWIHSDISKFKIYMENYEKYYQYFDKIYCVSKDAKMSFKREYPKFNEKVDLFYNIINKEEIYEKSKEESYLDKDFEGLRLLTVGRLTSEKGQERIPEILCSLLNNGYKVKWYLIGDGEKRESLQKLIKTKNLENNLILLGSKENPYPYFKDCDIYIQPSLHEGYCLTLAEAKLFNKPIVTTEFAGSFEQIENFKSGIRVKNTDEEIYKGILELLKNLNLKELLTLNLKKENEINNNRSIKL
ncbi:MAG: glycosyltransferase [Cetobacterium sp.]|uniref:glycosyltransferase n=1 Tax=Cetobacterium sp. TaxID=2071632 RepID=UPI003F3C8035